MNMQDATPEQLATPDTDEQHSEAFVTVIDAVMGAGKTHWMKRELASLTGPDAERHVRFVYITPYLEEAAKAVDDMTAAGAQDVRLVEFQDLPDEEKQSLKARQGRDRKRDLLYEMLMEGQSAVGSHRLFEVLDPRVMAAIETQNYVLVIDEAVQWVTKLKHSLEKSELASLFKLGVCRVGADLTIEWSDTVPGLADIYYNQHEAHYAGFRSLVMQRKVIAASPEVDDSGVPKSMLLWTMPVEMLKQFEHVFVLTHLFKGSEMDAYLTLHGIETDMMTLDMDRNLVPFTPEHNAARVTQLAGLITVEEDRKLNAIGNPPTRRGRGRQQDPLSKSWFETHKKEAQEIAQQEAQLMGKPPLTKPQLDAVRSAACEQLQRNLTSFFRYSCKTPARENLWTCFTDFREHLEESRGRHYRGSKAEPCFAACNARATNKFNHKTAVAYAVAINHDPDIRNYFKRRGVLVSNEFYALSTLVQFIWRSGIRRPEEEGGPLPVRVYIPSQRMRGLFEDYLQGVLPVPYSAS